MKTYLNNALRNPLNADVKAASKLKALRIAKGFSQKELAAQLGTTPQQLQKYEAAKNRLTIGRVQSICKVLEVQPAYFFE